MAIINNLESCLDSPYLARDGEAPARVAGLVAFASERIELAGALAVAAKHDPADVSLLAYEALFACVRALVYAQGYRESGLRCLLIALDHLYVGPGRLDPALVHAFGRAQTLELPPAAAIEAARSLLDRTRELVGPAAAAVEGGAAG